MSKQSFSNVEPCKIYVKFIPFETSNDEFKKYFSVCGKVIRFDLKTPSPSDYRNIKLNATPWYLFGFITYETQAEADRAVRELNNTEMTNGKGYTQILSVSACRHNKSKHDSEKVDVMTKNDTDDEEINELLKKKRELEEKKVELEKKNQSIIEGNERLRLQIKIKKLEAENLKLKGEKY